MTQARVKNFLIWFIVLFVAGYYGLILLDHPILEYSDILEISGSVIAVAALAYVVRRHSPQERLPWAVFLVAVFGSSWICMKTTLEKTGFSDGQRSVEASA